MKTRSLNVVPGIAPTKAVGGGGCKEDELAVRFLADAKASMERLSNVLDESSQRVFDLYIRLSILPRLRRRVSQSEDVDRQPLHWARYDLKTAFSLWSFLKKRNRSFTDFRKSDIEAYVAAMSLRASVRLFLKWLYENRMSNSKWLPSARRDKVPYKCFSQNEFQANVNRLFVDESISLRHRCFGILGLFGFRPSTIVKMRVNDVVSNSSIHVDTRLYPVLTELGDLFRRLADERSRESLCDLDRGCYPSLFGRFGSASEPSARMMLRALSQKHEIAIRTLRNTANRKLSVNLTDFVVASTSAGRSIGTVSAVAAHHKSRSASYAITMARAQRDEP